VTFDLWHPDLPDTIEFEGHGSKFKVTDGKQVLSNCWTMEPAVGWPNMAAKQIWIGKCK